jgi:proline iminopeptidase
MTLQTLRHILILFITNTAFFLFNLPLFSQQLYQDGKVDRSDFGLHYKIFGGTGPFIVVLGGGPGSTVDYMQPIADSLSKYYRCIMLEQRGTGRSVLKKYDTTTIQMNLYVEDIEDLRKHVKADKLILVGNSWGSLLSLLYAIKYPQNTRAIISLGSSPISSEYGKIFDDNFRARLLPEEKAVRNKWREKLKDSSTFVQANYERDKAGMPAYYYDRNVGLKAAMSLKPTDFNYYIFPAFDLAHPYFDIRPNLHKITSPVLLVQGRQDLAGESNIIEANQLIKQSTLKFIERCGHLPWEEKPTETWRVVYDFLNQHEYFR